MHTKKGYHCYNDSSYPAVFLNKPVHKPLFFSQGGFTPPFSLTLHTIQRTLDPNQRQKATVSTRPKTIATVTNDWSDWLTSARDAAVLPDVQQNRDLFSDALGLVPNFTATSSLLVLIRLNHSQPIVCVLLNCSVCYVPSSNQTSQPLPGD